MYMVRVSDTEWRYINEENDTRITFEGDNAAAQAEFFMKTMDIGEDEEVEVTGPDAFTVDLTGFFDDASPKFETPGLRNATEHEFVDISSEQWRRYWFPGSEEAILLEAPLFLSVGESGHRVLTANGHSHYIPYGWLEIEWKVKEGQPHF